ncbi:hypothetical protein Nepgr_007387 [Nepenthes gracilis]|uniref:Uncharacterized protein n=1 Tax=Nepenthes gracilis TaxID=150966 RepID=A0AAD3XI85_NEPGR|nr:hypothetical protein Nepgr_007387 [Nepenthes gracilis]
MDTPDDERHLFDHVTCNISSSVDEVAIPGALALDLIEQAEVEVERLDQLKFSQMKEIEFKKQAELKEIYAHAHKEIDAEAAREKILALDDSGNVEPSELIVDMDSQIAKAKEEALSRKEILNKVEKWMSACEEESWLKRLTFIKGYWKEPYFCISSSSTFALGEFSIIGSELLALYCCNLMYTLPLNVGKITLCKVPHG